MSVPVNEHFNKIFWFIVGLCLFGAFLTIFLVVYLPDEASMRVAETALIFWLSTAVGGGIGYLIGSSMSKTAGVNTTPGTTTADISATITTEPPKEEKKD